MLKENQYAVGQFNINNLEFTQAILQAAQEENSPVILGVSEGAARYMGGFRLIVLSIVKELMEEYKNNRASCHPSWIMDQALRNVYSSHPCWFHLCHD